MKRLYIIPRVKKVQLTTSSYLLDSSDINIGGTTYVFNAKFANNFIDTFNDEEDDVFGISTVDIIS